MSLNLALAGAGLLGGLLNNSRGNKMAGKGYGYLDQAATTAGQGYRRLVDFYNNQQAMGAYDPSASIALANKDAANTFQLGTGNIGARAARLGYKAGDSNIEQGQKDFTQQGQLALQQRILGLRDQYGRQQMGDLSNINNAAGGYANTLASIGNNFVGYGNTMANQGGGIGGVLSGLGSIGGLGGSSGGYGGGYSSGGSAQGPNLPGYITGLGGLHW